MPAPKIVQGSPARLFCHESGEWAADDTEDGDGDEEEGAVADGEHGEEAADGI